ncbi:Large proline-rich protein bag6 [Ancistrocladus abbreviatus]
MELPRYQYAKSMPRECHCCGCHNHPCHVKEDNNVKIEEQETETENRKDSLVPAWVKESPHPIVWIPPGYMKSKEQQRKPVKTDVEDSKKVPQDAKSEQITTQSEPKAWNGWPEWSIAISHLLGSLHDYRNDDKRAQKGIDASQKPAQEPSSFRIVPVKLLHPNGGMDISNAAVDDHKSRVRTSATAEIGNMEKTREKQMDELAKMNVNDNECKVGDALVENPEDKVYKKSVKNDAKKQPSSPTKTSKLPPVRLQVDPLPKKKLGNGSCRSPSPPGNKEMKMQNDATTATSLFTKESIKRDTKGPKVTEDKRKEQMANRKEIKVTEATERKSF